MDDYWLTLLVGAHIESRVRFKKRQGKPRAHVPARVQQVIDRIRLEQGLEPLYPTDEREVA